MRIAKAIASAARRADPRRDGNRRTAITAALPIALAAFAGGPAAADLPDLLSRIRWGENAAALVRAFGARAKALDPPIEFGDAQAAVVLPDERIGGHRFVVYFQTDRADGGLKRIHLERPRHGAVQGIHRDVLAALETSYGPATQICVIPPTGAHGYQRAETRLWRLDGALLRATFRDTTLRAGEACLGAPSPCGPTAQLFIQIGPPAAIPEPCG